MSIAIEVLIQSSSQPQQDEIKNRLLDLIRNNGFHVDQSSYTPSEAVQSELAAVPTSRATIKIFEA